MAKIIVLNGISSAGKSSLARAIQANSKRDWLHVSLDQFIAMLPDGREMNPEWFVVEEVDSSPQPVVSITNGPRGKLLMQSMRDFVRIAADKDLYVVVDDVGTTAEIADYRAKLSDHELTIVKIDVDLATAERRERVRGDRMLGLARQQWGRIHKGVDYDIELENPDGELEATARRLLSTVEC